MHRQAKPARPIAGGCAPFGPQAEGDNGAALYYDSPAMAQARSRAAAQPAAVISRSTVIRGRVQGDGDMVVEGAIDGDIILHGAMHVRDGARVRADHFEVDELVLEGELEANVQARGGVHVRASGKLVGDVRGGGFALDEGAAYSGHIDCDFELPDELRALERAGRR